MRLEARRQIEDSGSPCRPRCKVNRLRESDRTCKEEWGLVSAYSSTRREVKVWLTAGLLDVPAANGCRIRPNSGGVSHPHIQVVGERKRSWDTRRTRRG